MSGFVDEFLVERDPVWWAAPGGFPAALRPAGLFAQDAPSGLEVVLVESSGRPTAAVMRRGWLRRRAGRASPVLLVAFYRVSGCVEVSVCGPVGDRPVVHHGLDVSQVERLVAVALGEPSHHAAARFLLASLGELGSAVPGLRNVGLLATHELMVGVRDMGEWPEAVGRSSRLLGERGRGLVEGLGFSVQVLGVNTSMLTVAGRNRAVAVFCDEDEPFDSPAGRFDGASPVSRGLAVADQQNVDWVILTRASEIRLYAARTDTGVGRKGRAETFVELNLSLLASDVAGYLHVLFSADALVGGGTLEKVLGNSERFAAELATRLRERVYFDTVPALSKAVADRLGRHPGEEELDDAYEQVMLILFRLLFVAYAEDKDLLPYSTNSHYNNHSLKGIARRLLEDRQQGRDRYDKRATAFWDDIVTLWDAVDQGNVSWGVPAYNGGLFSDDTAISPAGAVLSSLGLTDAEFAPVLARLLIDDTPEGEGPVDFRDLSVREFGTIYEGLLESRLAVAQEDLAVQKLRGKDEHVYVPATGDDPVWVEAGAVYLHNRLGVRKATGSYFTKPFAVEHLLDSALEKALDAHIARLDRLWQADDMAGLSEAFFDFRCADIAMGSGHFLVAALDRIEARLSGWIALHPVPTVNDELLRLRSTALGSLGDLGVGTDIERTSLIRRQVARHCVYGVDLNRVAVELARLAIWVHTFVPGLPLSFLDHNLVCGNSLTGVGYLDEVIAEFDPDADPDMPSLFRSQLEDLLAHSRSALVRLARTSDATKREIDEARTAHREAQAAVAGATALFDVVAAHRAGACHLPVNHDETTIITESKRPAVVEQIRKMKPVHFPAAFPEVFLRERPGFDCVLGNPPWEKAKVERQQWWGRHQPGIRALSVGKMNAAINRLRKARPDLDRAYQRDMEQTKQTAALLRRTFALGSGDTDLYQAFGWRFWHLLAEDGTIGVVLPRGALRAPGYQKWRKAILANGTFTDVTQLVNNGKWVFEDVHQQYTIALCSIGKGKAHPGKVAMRGPYASHIAYNHRSHPTEITTEEFNTWSDMAAFPLIPSDAALATFRKLRNHPRLDRSNLDHFADSHAKPKWRVRPYAELHSSADKHRFVLDAGEKARTPGAGHWPVYSGRSFDLWEPDTGAYYASVDAGTIFAHLQSKRERSRRYRRSVFSEFDPVWIENPSTLAFLHPRILFRDVTRATDTRSVRAALVPGQLVAVDLAPSLLWPKGTARDEAYLLGVLCSMILDWYARRVVEMHVKFNTMNSFPVPNCDVSGDMVAARVVEIAGRLAAVDDRFSGWAAEVGVPVGSARDEATRQDLIHELDACVALLYGLDESDLAVIHDTFHEGADYSERHLAVLEHFRRWGR